MKIAAAILLVSMLLASACGYASPAGGLGGRQILIRGTITEVVDRATVRVTLDGTKAPAEVMTLRSFAGTKYRGMATPASAGSFSDAGFGLGLPVSAEVATDAQGDGAHLCYVITSEGR